MSLICGIDPGLKGAIALYDTNSGFYWIEDMPTLKAGTKNKHIIDDDALVVILKKHPIDHAFVEAVGAMPKNGSVAMFTFGTGYGVIKGILAALSIPRTYVRPNVWKKALMVHSNKDSSRVRASQLLPTHSDKWPLKKDDGRAEAALIAYYGAHKTFRTPF